MHEFFGQLSRIINTGKSRSVLLTGNVYDLFYDGKSFVPLVDFLSAKYAVPPNGTQKGLIQVLYEVNKKVRVVGGEDVLRNAWNEHYKVLAFPVSGVSIESIKASRQSTGLGLAEVVRMQSVPKKDEPKADPNDFDLLINKTKEYPTFALEFLRKVSEIARSQKIDHNLVIIVENVDMLVPNKPLAQMDIADRARIAILHDWFSDPAFVGGHDSVILTAESRAMVNDLVTALPQVLTVAVPNPNREERAKYAETIGKEPRHLEFTAGLSIHAYRQLLADPEIVADDVVRKVEEYIVSLVGDDVVEFKRPSHTLDDATGFAQVKVILKTQLLSRIQDGDPENSIPGALIPGPIGGGKTFLLEGVAGMAGVPVMVLKNFRSQWFGQTDVMVERIRRAIYAIVQDGGRLVIFADEADTLFGGLGQDTHETERRSTGKFQALMSDPVLRGKVIWLLMTARPHLLSPDMRREGRAGELVIPILDPSDYGEEEQRAFVDWLLEAAGIAPHGEDVPVEIKSERNSVVQVLMRTTKDWSAGKFRAVRSRIKAEKATTIQAVQAIMDDTLSPNIGDTRRYQKLQALLNTSRKSFMPKGMDYQPEKWQREIRELEARGVR